MSQNFIKFAEIQNFTIEQLIDKIISSKKLIIGEIKMVDLIFEKQSMTGVYLIFDEQNKPVYVGKTGSRVILERIAAHLDLGPGAYMNSFLCALAGKRKKRNGPIATEEELIAAFDKALNYKLVFVQIPNCNEHKAKIGKIESLISAKLKTEYNSRRNDKDVDVSIKISSIK